MHGKQTVGQTGDQLYSDSREAGEQRFCPTSLRVPTDLKWVDKTSPRLDPGPASSAVA